MDHTLLRILRHWSIFVPESLRIQLLRIIYLHIFGAVVCSYTYLQLLWDSRQVF